MSGARFDPLCAGDLYIRDYNLRVRARYDWCDPLQTRSPEDYPYAFSEYWIIRPAPGILYQPFYSDRMREWDGVAYEKALRASGWTPMQEHPTTESLHKMVDTYFGSEFKLAGYARSCNVSNGYPLGIFAVWKV